MNGRRASAVTAGCTAAAGALALLPLLAGAQRPGIAEQLPPGAPPAAQACIGCHGAQGQGNPESGTPRIAGQSQHYLLKQLESYAERTRRSPVMEPIARGLPPEIREEVARYYAQSLARVVETGDAAGAPPERGRVLATEGDNALGVQACRNCHGPGGVGEPPNIPYLAGLDADYIAHELRAFKQGTRTNDAGQQMFTVVAGLPEADIEAVARYYASLTPPEPAPPSLVRAAPPAQPQAQVRRVVPAGGADEAAQAPSLGGGSQAAATGAPQTAGPPAGAAERAPPAGDVQAESAGRPGRVGAGQGSATTGGTQGAGGTGGSAVEREDASESRQQPPQGGESGQVGRGEGQEQTQEPPWPAIVDEPKPAQPQSFAPSAPGDPERGRAIVASGEYGCPTCHTIPGIDWPRGIVGPPLENFGHRALIAGRLPNDLPTLAAFVFNAPAMVPGTGMPNLGLSFEEARHVAAYLRTLGEDSAD